MYDPICQTVAEKFLPDGPPEAIEKLAQRVQDTVEDWLTFDSDSPECEQGTVMARTLTDAELDELPF